MKSDAEFVDYYDLLQVNPNCDQRILEIAYRYFAKMYHPDHAETADADKFKQVIDAYNALRDPGKRAEYDKHYFGRTEKPASLIFSANGADTAETTAIADAQIHERILLHLYRKRREHANEAGVVAWLLQEMLECSEAQFEFHIWYLRSKNLIEATEHGTLAITIEGVDQVISNSRAHQAEKLLPRRSPDLA